MTFDQAGDISVEPLTQIQSSVIMDWQLSSYFGWGVYGLNLMLNWMQQQTNTLLTSLPVDASQIDINPVEWMLIRSAVEQSHSLQARFEALAGQAIGVNVPVLHALGNDFGASASNAVQLSGRVDVGLTFFEFTNFSPERLERTKAFCLIVTGSTWNQRVLESAGAGPSALAMQGIDPTAFHPAPKADWFAGRFAIFSGGKLEYRKGQDLVLKAFRAFARRHPDAVLVTAWASPWPSVAASVNATSALTPVLMRPNGDLDVEGWAAANGIAPGQVIDLGALPNSAMPRLYREMDVGLFPNRCEGGTNLVAMECMACGIPVILSRNTGHLDLIAPDRCFALEQQSRIEGADHIDWGESDVEEIVETLEAVRRDRAGRLERGERAAQFMKTMTWADTVRRLTEVIAPYV